ncbi:MAG: hypothetical protein M1822_008147 [Bathelium mastoideum]|nr:MAG: hypothetical protein M1822_008147 [Bathelium mastoideum]
MKHLRDSSKMFDELQSHEFDIGQTRTVIIATCFLDYKGDAFAKSIEGLLRTILFHIVTQHKDFFQHIRPTYRNLNGRSNDGIIWTLATLERCFFDLVQRSSHARFMLLVDALDEYAGEDSEIATFLVRLSESSPNNLQICASSRPHVDFEEEFDSCARLQMEHETEHDIREYVQGQFRAFIDRHGKSYTYLVDDIVSNSRGLFVWVKLACIEILRAARRGEDIEMLSKRLESMPQELDDFYQRMLDLLDPEERQEAQAMLAITISSYKTFTPVELRYMIHFATGRYAEFNEFLAETRILAVCGGFLEFGPYDVRLAHRTVYHFLEVSRPSLLQSRNRDGKWITGEVLLSDACIKALTQIISKSSETTGPGAETLRPFEELTDKNVLASFYVYALQHWLAHAIRSEAKTHQAQSSLSLLKGSMFEKWRLIAQSESYVKATILLDNVHYSITALEWPGRGLKKGEKWHTINKWWHVARSLGVGGGLPNDGYFYDDIPETLIEMMASCGVDIYVTQALNEILASSSATGGNSLERKRLLYAIARGGSTELAERLFASGITIEANDGWTELCLTRSIYHGHHPLCKLFIAKGADLYRSVRCRRSVRSEQVEFGSPMEVALQASNSAAVRHLLSCGFDTNRRISYWGSALQVAKEFSGKDLIDIILAHGADPHVSYLPTPGDAVRYGIFSQERLEERKER